MKSTMQDYPLTTARLLKYGSTAHGASTVATWTGTPWDTGWLRADEGAAISKSAASQAAQA